MPLIEWPQNIRLDGQQQRKDRSLISSWVISDHSGGLGKRRMSSDADLNRLWDAQDVDTRWNDIILSPALNTCTIVPSRGDLELAFNYLGDLYFTETQRAGPFAYKFAPPFTIGSQIHIGSTNAPITFGSLRAIEAVGNKIYAIARGISGTENYMALYSGSLGGSPLTENKILTSAFAISKLGYISNMGGTLHGLFYNDTGNEYLMYLRSIAVPSQSITSVVGLVGTFIPKMVSDGLTMYAQLPEGIYDFDSTPAVAIDTSRSQDKNGAMVMFQNYLHFKNKYSLLKYDGINIVNVGYDRGDGLPADKMGEITCMTSSWRNIFAAVKGGTFSHILSWDGQGWQYYARIPSAGVWVRDMFLSDSPDAIDRLWCMFGNSNYPAYFLNPMVNPLQAGTYPYYSYQGNFILPEFAGGIFEEPGAFYDNLVTSGSLGGGGNLIYTYYDINGKIVYASTLGAVSTSPTQQQVFGSPYGIEAYSIQPKYILAKDAGTNSISPIFKEATIHYLKLPKVRETYEFTIDLFETAQQETNPLEAVIGSLNYENSSRPLLPFWYGKVATKAVKIIDMPSIEDIDMDRMFGGERKGDVTVKVAEIL